MWSERQRGITDDVKVLNNGQAAGAITCDEGGAGWGEGMEKRSSDLLAGLGVPARGDVKRAAG